MRENEKYALPTASQEPAVALGESVQAVQAGGTALEADAPRLFFSDLESGPRTGNSDTSQGQPAGEDGAIVTIWGMNLGSDQAASRIVCNGAPPRVYYWGDALPPWSPANLHNEIQKMQMVIFQVSHLAKDGAGQITVGSKGTSSNSLPFTVRPGRIFFIKTSGSDRGSGSWSKPWRTINRATNRFNNTSIAPGDIFYAGDGVSQGTAAGNDDEWSAVNLNSDGTPDKPLALVAYPGARVTVGNPALDAVSSFVTNLGHASTYWTIAKLSLAGNIVPLPLGTGFRAVGNYVTAPRGDGAEGTIEAHGSHISILGNELTNCGSPNSSYLYHVIYVSGHRQESGARLPTELDREIAWNYLHDNFADRGINIYSEGESSAFIQGHRVHHNVIVNQRGDGILLGYYVTGENWVYDNLIINSGLGPEWPDGSSSHTCLNIRGGQEALSRSLTVLHVLQNTLHGCGSAAGAKSNGALELVRLALYQLDFRNNLVDSAQPYLSGYSERPEVGSNLSSHNLWFGAGRAPDWDDNSISADPQFINPAGMDFHLGPHSPAIDRGSPTVSLVVKTDLDGVPRPLGSGFDIGAYEFLFHADSRVSRIFRSPAFAAATRLRP